MEFIKETDEAIALWSEGDIEDAVFNSPEEYIYEFSEVMALISKHHFHSSDLPNENFSFIANSSLSGGAHPCSAPECRKKRLNQLASFSALYADEVYIQNPFENILLRGNQSIREFERQEILAGIQNYFYLRPLIEKGIIKYATVNVNFCEQHSSEIGKPIAESIGRKQEKLVQALDAYLKVKCKVTFDFSGGNKSKPFFEIAGPEDIIEHGTVYLHAYEPIPDVFTLFMKKEGPYILNPDEIEESRILDQIIGPIVNDLSTQEWHSALNGTSYLCDNKTHMKVASKINNKVYAANSDVFEKSLEHYLPAIYSKDPSAILDLRLSEEEAFAVYRDKLNKFMQESSSWGEVEVSKIFRDQLLPEINLIEKKVKDWKSNAREGIAQKLLFGTATASFGLYEGLLPANIGEIVTAIGGATAVAGTLMEYNKTLKEKQEARKNDFYFLWQVSQ
ncbi:MAG: hypothetical protein KUG83_00695 [Gammaproteobacteria bacterium]|nr:hypothetical protein [Gammaproteobacteria bacterium]